MSNQPKETKIATLLWEEQAKGIIRLIHSGQELVNIKDGLEVLETLNNHFPHPNRKLIIDISNVKGINTDFRNFMNGPDGIYNYINAIAVYSEFSSSPGSIVVNAMLSVMKLRKPTKLFKSKSDALKWLESLN